jgi:hypothetical protein
MCLGRRTLVFELLGAGLLSKVRLQKVGNGGFATGARGWAGGGWVQAIEDEEIALGIVECGKGGYTLEMIERGEGVHFVVVDLVPGDIPARVIGLDTNGKIHGAEVIADRRQTGHERELGATDREDERVVTGVGGDDVTDLVGGTREGVVGGTDVVESLAGVGNYKGREGGSNRCDGKATQCGLGDGGSG